MDDELESLEAELKALEPTRPSAQLEQQIARRLGTGKYGRATWWWLAAVPLPVAAAVAILLALARTESNRNGVATTATPASTRNATDGAAKVQPEVPSDALKPVAARNVLYSATDEGLVTLADGTTARRERLKFVGTIKWQNPRTHASLIWSVPGEEVRVVPVRYQ